MPADPVVGSTVLRRPAIQSPNYVAGSAGWTINQDGSAEFNNLTIRGTFAGTDFVINSDGSFFYSPSEGAGNLVASIAAASGVDQFGNNYVSGVGSYQTGFASQLAGGVVVFYHGSLAGGWIQGGQIETSSSGGLVLDAGGATVTVTGPLSVNGSGSTASAGLTDGTINGSSQQVGLPNGTITGTSGGASAGTAHTHGGGSYSVTNGQHSHGPGNYAVTNGSHAHVL